MEQGAQDSYGLRSFNLKDYYDYVYAGSASAQIVCDEQLLSEIARQKVFE